MERDIWEIIKEEPHFYFPVIAFALSMIGIIIWGLTT